MSRRQGKTQTRSRKTKRVTCETVRHLALALPGVEEGASGGAPVFRVRGKMMARVHDSGESLLVKIDYLKRDILLNAEPETFFIRGSYSCYPMIFVRLSRVDGDTLRAMLEDAWRLVASKRLVESYNDKPTD